MKYVMATHNPNKLLELQRILEPLHIEVTTADLQEVEETGTTFAENAYLKAKAACEQTGLPAVADDSGLVVDALNGAPGVYSARYAGPDATDAQRTNCCTSWTAFRQNSAPRGLSAPSVWFPPMGSAWMWKASVKGAWRLRRAAMMDSDMTRSFWWAKKHMRS